MHHITNALYLKSLSLKVSFVILLPLSKQGITHISPSDHQWSPVITISPPTWFLSVPPAIHNSMPKFNACESHQHPNLFWFRLTDRFHGHMKATVMILLSARSILLWTLNVYFLATIYFQWPGLHFANTCVHWCYQDAPLHWPSGTCKAFPCGPILHKPKC